MEDKINQIYVTGDSYAWQSPDNYSSRLWTHLLSSTTGLVNRSCPGCSQDWNLCAVYDWQDVITPDDQLIFILTDPSRFWFIENLPQFSNSWILESEFDRHGISLTVQESIRKFITHIQRPSLDILMLANRLGALNNLATIKKWRKPIVILAFPQHIPDIANYTNLIISKGNLFDISKKEEDWDDSFYRGVDVRYNHLTLSNHKILAEKIIQTIETGNELDLTNGFNTKILTNESVNNPAFIDAELSAINYKAHHEAQHMGKKYKRWPLIFKN